jgi:serine/threonine protein kinase
MPHRGGIIHCDVKPANLLVASDGTVTMVDFGVARSAAATTTTAATAVLGTALYMAPEQVSGHPVSPTTDIYALGAVAYHCLGGRAPFTGESLLEIALRHLSDEPPPLPSDVPPALRIVITRAMSKDPARRYPPRPTSPTPCAAPWRATARPGPRCGTCPVVRDPPARPRRSRGGRGECRGECRGERRGSAAARRRRVGGRARVRLADDRPFSPAHPASVDGHSEHGAT